MKLTADKKDSLYILAHGVATSILGMLLFSVLSWQFWVLVVFSVLSVYLARRFAILAMLEIVTDASERVSSTTSERLQEINRLLAKVDALSLESHRLAAAPSPRNLSRMREIRQEMMEIRDKVMAV